MVGNQFDNLIPKPLNGHNSYRSLFFQWDWALNLFIFQDISNGLKKVQLGPSFCSLNFVPKVLDTPWFQFFSKVKMHLEVLLVPPFDSHMFLLHVGMCFHCFAITLSYDLLFVPIPLGSIYFLSYQETHYDVFPWS